MIDLWCYDYNEIRVRKRGWNRNGVWYERYFLLIFLNINFCVGYIYIWLEKDEVFVDFYWLYYYLWEG